MSDQVYAPPYTDALEAELCRAMGVVMKTNDKALLITCTIVNETLKELQGSELISFDTSRKISDLITQLKEYK